MCLFSEVALSLWQLDFKHNTFIRTIEIATGHQISFLNLYKYEYEYEFILQITFTKHDYMRNTYMQ